MSSKIEKYESVERLKELSPIDTLKIIGFKEDMTLCDIGAGTGVFSFPAAKISSNDIYALEKSEDMIVKDKGFHKVDSFSMGDNLYCFVYQLS